MLRHPINGVPRKWHKVFFARWKARRLPAAGPRLSSTRLLAPCAESRIHDFDSSGSVTVVGDQLHTVTKIQYNVIMYAVEVPECVIQMGLVPIFP